jgi:hypothetical protein
MESHVLGPGEASCARGAAIDPGGLDRVEELAVRSGVAGDHGCPAEIVYRGGRKLFGVGRGFHVHSFKNPVTTAM